METRVITDSSCDLPDELLKRYDIEMVPLYVTFDDNSTFLDRVTIAPEEFWERMGRCRLLPKTSRPAPEAFARVFRESLTRYKSVVYVGISSALSGTFESASLAARSVSGDIHIIDSLTGSLGLGILAVKASQFVRSGMNIQSVVSKVAEYRDGMNTLFTMDSLENLIKGGRVARLPGFIGSKLDIKPIGKAGDDGRIDLLEKVRGRKKSLQRIVQLMAEMGTGLQEKIVGVSHLDCLEDAMKLKEIIEERYHPADVIVSKVGSTMGTYAGRGGIILAF